MLEVHISKHSLFRLKITVGCLVCGVVGGVLWWCVVVVVVVCVLWWCVCCCVVWWSLAHSLSCSLSSLFCFPFFFSLIFLFLLLLLLLLLLFLLLFFLFLFFLLSSLLPTLLFSSLHANKFIATANELHGMFPPLLLPPPLSPPSSLPPTPRKKRGDFLLQEYFQRGIYFYYSFLNEFQKIAAGENYSHYSFILIQKTKGLYL